MPQSAHEEWNPVVLEGTRNAVGMPGFGVSGMTAEEALAIQSYVIDRAWAAYERGQAVAGLR